MVPLPSISVTSLFPFPCGCPTLRYHPALTTRPVLIVSRIFLTLLSVIARKASSAVLLPSANPVPWIGGTFERVPSTQIVKVEKIWTVLPFFTTLVSLPEMV